MENVLKQMELDTLIGGMNQMDYMASIIDRNDHDLIAIEKGKLNIAVLQQMNNRSRIILDAYKFQLKKNEQEMAPKEPKDEPKEE